MSKNEKNYSDKDLNGMSNGELARLGTELDDVTVAYRKERFPIDNDPAEKRASRAVALWLGIGVLSAIAFLGVYIAWPWQYKGLGDEGVTLYTFYTPLLGITAGLAILSLGFAVVLYVKTIIPEEIAVQRRQGWAQAVRWTAPGRACGRGAWPAQAEAGQGAAASGRAMGPGAGCPSCRRGRRAQWE